MLKVAPTDLVETVKTTQTIWAQMLEQYNLATAVRTIPVGIPSLMARLSPISSPLSWNPVVEIPSTNWAVAALGILLTIGFLLGSLFFYMLKLETEHEHGKFIFKDYLRLMSTAWHSLDCCLGIAILISVPVALHSLGSLSLECRNDPVHHSAGRVWVVVVDHPAGIFCSRHLCSAEKTHAISHSFDQASALLPAGNGFVCDDRGVGERIVE